MAKIIALVGKGGVGKTTICSAFVRILGEKYPAARILAIDADPAVGLATALGVEVTETLDDIRREIIDRAQAGAGKEAVELLGEVRFRIFDALVETPRFAFLAIGRPEGAGCYCAVNAYLKEVIDMVSKDFDYVVIDGEAGIEQVNRRVMEKVTHLFLVTDASKKGMQVAASIRQVAEKLVMFEKCGVIVNRVEDPEFFSAHGMQADEEAGKRNDDGLRSGSTSAHGMQADEEEQGTIRAVKDAQNPMGMVGGAEVVAVIPSDSAHARNDMLGKSIFALSQGAPVLKGAEKALLKLMEE